MANLNLDHVVTYTPEVDENRESETPWTISFAPMTAGDNRRYLAAAMSNGKDSIQKALTVLRKIFTERVTEVSGLKDIHGGAISTGLEFYEQSEQTYIDEVYEAMTKASILRGGLKKS